MANYNYDEAELLNKLNKLSPEQLKKIDNLINNSLLDEKRAV